MKRSTDNRPVLTTRDWRSISWRTALVTLAGTLLSIGSCFGVAVATPGGVPIQGWIAAIAMPLVLVLPTTLYLLVQQHKLKRAYALLHLVASTDALTSCLSRGAFTREVSNRLESLEDIAPQPNDALLVIDADDFKRINDTFGHDRGDEALKAIADAIRSNVRDGDLVGRIGGEEFGAYLANADLATATAVAERIRKAIAALPFRPAGERHKLSVSIGGVVVRRPADFVKVYKLADQKLYAAKHAGRDRVVMLRAA